ncbi:MAG: two-component regulator propeller domain-containing protein [Syntrophothermus sp.]
MYFGTEDGLNIFDGYKFSVIRSSRTDTNSISYNDINSLFEDREKIIWIGTFNAGLNRFDPSIRKVTRFTFNPGNTNSLSNNNINAITEDLNGNLWIGTDNGLCRLEKYYSRNVQYRFTRYYNERNDRNTLINNRVLSLCTDHSGNIWVGTDAGINKLIVSGPSPRFIQISINSENKNSSGDNAIRAIYEDKRGNVWFGSNNGLMRLINTGSNHSSEFIIYRNNPKYENSLSSNDIYAINEDPLGLIWVGTNGGGIDLINAETGRISHLRHDRFNPGSLCYDEIRSILRDRSGIMWIGTYGSGISKAARSGEQFYHYIFRPNDQNSLSHSIVWSIYEDKDSVLWIGTHNGLDRLDRRKNKYTHYKNNPADPKSLSGNTVRVITGDGTEKLWIGTHGGGISVFNKLTGKCRVFKHDPLDSASLALNAIRSIYRDRSGIFWIGTYGAGMEKYDQITDSFKHFRNIPGNNESLSNDFVRVIFEDKAGNFWIGTEGGGVDKFDRKTGKFKRYMHNPADGTSLSSDHVFAIHEDKDGTLWIGTWGGGLNKFNPKTEKFKCLTADNGLPSNSIYAVAEDNFGNLWISTNAGLSKYDLRTNTFTNYTVKDGLQDNEFNGGSYFKGNNGELFFGGINGFNSFFPDHIKSNTYIPPVIITSFSKLNKEVDFGRPVSEVREIELSYKDYVFAFEFAALDYLAPEKNKYAYKMEGLDDNWVFVNAAKRFAYYTTLPPGKYTFMVKATNSDGIWNNKGTSVRLIITPPFWKTNLFTAIALLVLVGLGYFLYKRRLKIIGMKIELKAAHDSQMSIMPHSDPLVDGLDVSGICIPASEVGGDFFDYFQHNNSRDNLGILIGDASGKAMKAAMTAVLASGMIMTFNPAAEDIKTIFTKVNRVLYARTDKRIFVAACILLIDVISNKIRYVNAGNINPIVKTNGAVINLQSSEPRFPLGLTCDVHYEEKTSAFNKGDIVFLITDGIIEAQTKTKEFYGMERLCTLISKTDLNNLSASEIKRMLISDIERFCNDGSNHDDMTIIVIKRV